MLYYGCETVSLKTASLKTASLALREEHRLKLFVDVVQMKILGSEWWHVTGGCRQLHAVCCALNVVRGII